MSLVNVPRQIIIEVQDTESAAAAPRDNLFCSQAWAEAITTPYELELNWAEELGETTSALPYVSLDSVGGPRVIALPFSDYLPLSSEVAVTELAERLRAKHPSAAITIKTQLSNTVELAGARISRKAVLHTITPNGPGPNAKFRANGRRATRDGVTVRKVSDEAALRRFYTLYADLRTRKFKSIPQPYSFFFSIFRQFIQDGRGYFVEAVFNDKVIASFIILLSGTRAFHKFSASSLDRLVPRPNNLIFSFLYDELAAGSITSIDLGLSGLGESYAGLRYFKSTAGGTESPITYYEWIPSGFNIGAEKLFKAHLGKITARMVEAELSADQLSNLSEAVYPHFV